MKTVTMIDPPYGWKYGFPKPLELRYPEQSHREWLVEQGYPQSEIDRCGEYFPCRYWEEQLRTCESK